MADSRKTRSQTPSFEEAMDRLESIVEAMENEDLPLERLLKEFEEGAELARLTQKRLVETDLKIQKLERSTAGELTAEPFVADDEDADEAADTDDA